jgi:excisionase family DNA binding protein
MKVTTKIKKTFCTSCEAAELLGVSIGTVQAWVGNGLLSAWKTAGGHRRISRESVRKLSCTEISSTEIDNSLVTNQCIAAIAVDGGLEHSAVMELTRYEYVHLGHNFSLDDGFQIFEIIKSNPRYDKKIVVVVEVKK